jgi:hypothetical protein
VELNLYQQIIGSLLYLALKTRLDILTAVCILSRFTKCTNKVLPHGCQESISVFTRDNLSCP